MNNITEKYKTPADWSAALRSGEYRQHRPKVGTLNSGMLRNTATDDYCCLGVLLEISPGFEFLEEVDTYTTDFSPASNCQLRYRLESQKPEWMSNRQEGAAIIANDKLRWTFKRIADWVDAGMPIDPKSNDSRWMPVDPWLPTSKRIQ